MSRAKEDFVVNVYNLAFLMAFCHYVLLYLRGLTAFIHEYR